MTNTPADRLHKARMIELSKFSCVLAEERKLNVEAGYCFAPLESVDALITDATVSPALTEKANKLGVNIISAE